MKKPIPIESLLCWAYSELLKQPEGDSSWNTMFKSQSWQTGCRVDQSSPDFVPDCLRSDPHPDAVAIDSAVRKIGTAQLNWSKDADALLGHLAVYLDWLEVLSRCRPWQVSGMARNRAAVVTHAKNLIDGHHTNVQGLLISHAVSRSRPIWHLGEPKVIPAKHSNGQKQMGGVPLRMYGMASTGSECLLALEPSALEIAIARFEFFMWHQALTELSRALTDLRDFAPEEPVYSAYPWYQDQRLWVVTMSKFDKHIKAVS